MYKIVSFTLFSIITLVLVACNSASLKPSTTAHLAPNMCSSALVWSNLKQKCINIHYDANFQIPHHSQTIYVILSNNKQSAEIFSNHHSGQLLDAVKGGYLSKDNTIRLLKTLHEWKIYFE